MGSITKVVSTFSSQTVTGFSTLATATYLAQDSAYNFTSANPWDAKVEVAVTVGTVSGNKQMQVFAIASPDGSNFTSGPTSGTTATDEPCLYYVGTMSTPTNSTAYKKQFDLAAAFGDSLPRYCKIVVKNDTGATLSAGSLGIAEVSLATA
jgi:hypothetical protein